MSNETANLVDVLGELRLLAAARTRFLGLLPGDISTLLNEVRQLSATAALGFIEETDPIYAALPRASTIVRNTDGVGGPAVYASWVPIDLPPPLVDEGVYSNPVDERVYDTPV